MSAAAHAAVIFECHSIGPKPKTAAAPFPFLNGAFDPVPALHAGDQQQVPRCNALDGEIGKAVSCSIYLNRPSPCREFDQSGENGLRNEACDRARERYGLPPLPVPLPLSLPETTIVEEIGVVQFAGCHSGVEQGTITH